MLGAGPKMKVTYVIITVITARHPVNFMALNELGLPMKHKFAVQWK